MGARTAAQGAGVGARRGVCVTVLLAAACVSCAQTTQPAEYGDPVAVCTLRDDRIDEASGLAASRRNPGCYYIQNDSGDQPRVFLVDRTGRTRLTIRLKGAAAVDWEDIAMAPAVTPGSFEVCVADIGDNKSQRAHVAIYRFAEPDVGQFADGATIDVDVTTYRVRYAGGPADAEAFCVEPATGDGYILTKRPEGGSLVYRLAAPWQTEGVTVLPQVATLEPPVGLPLTRVVTAAGISPDGRRLAVRCYLGGWEWELPEAGTVGEAPAATQASDFERIFSTDARPLLLPPEPQGEALCYAADGRAVLTVSEGRRPILWEVPAATGSGQPSAVSSQPER